MAIATEITADSPNIWWEFKETAGSSVADSSGNGQTGTINSPGTDTILDSTTLDGVNPSFEFNIAAGTSAYVYRNPVSGWPTGDITVEILFAIDETTSSADNMGLINYAISTELDEWFLEVRKDSAGDSLFELFIDGTQLLSSFKVADASEGGRPNKLFPDGRHGFTQHHIVVTYNTSTGETSVYLDGVRIYRETLTSGLTCTDGGSLMVAQEIGSYPTGLTGNNEFTGRLAQFAVYPTVLSPERVYAHYAAIEGIEEDTPSGTADTTTPTGSSEQGSLHAVGGIPCLTSPEATAPPTPTPTPSGIELEVSGILALTSNRVRVTFNQPVVLNNALVTAGNYVFSGPSDVTAAGVFPESVSEPTYVDVTLNEEMQEGGSYTLNIEHIEGTLEP